MPVYEWSFNAPQSRRHLRAESDLLGIAFLENDVVVRRVWVGGVFPRARAGMLARDWVVYGVAPLPGGRRGVPPVLDRGEHAAYLRGLVVCRRVL